MRYVAAYMLAVLGGQEAPKAADIEKILSSVGIEADAESAVVEQLAGKNLEELIAQGREKLSSMPVGGAVAATAAAPAAGADAGKKEEKKEEKKKEESESEDDDMGFGLFE
uniref:Large ribosomal subunit protein P2 n=1 Tax=Megaselia scalaris TaxID=36166 RepID=T1H6I7_MEGSC